MASIFGVDIPSGLESLFYSLFGYPNSVTQDALRTNNSAVPRKRRASLLSNSLFLLWEPVWQTFDTTRRDAWQSYWELLPFGSHLGSRGYPGSGYSAFVFLNAPRHKVDYPLFDIAPESNDVDVSFAVGEQSDGFQDFSGGLGHFVFDFVASADDEANGTLGIGANSIPVWVSHFSLLQNPFTAPVELMSNGSFSSGMDDWYVLSGSMSNSARSTYGGAIIREDRLIVQDVAIVEGNSYRFSFDYQVSPPF